MNGTQLASVRCSVHGISLEILRFCATHGHTKRRETLTHRHTHKCVEFHRKQTPLSTARRRTENVSGLLDVEASSTVSECVWVWCVQWSTYFTDKNRFFPFRWATQSQHGQRIEGERKCNVNAFSSVYLRCDLRFLPCSTVDASWLTFDRQIENVFRRHTMAGSQRWNGKLKFNSFNSRADGRRDELENWRRNPILLRGKSRFVWSNAHVNYI